MILQEQLPELLPGSAKPLYSCPYYTTAHAGSESVLSDGRCRKLTATTSLPTGVTS